MARTSAQAGENPSPLKNVPRIDGEAPRIAPWAFWREFRAGGEKRARTQNNGLSRDFLGKLPAFRHFRRAFPGFSAFVSRARRVAPSSAGLTGSFSGRTYLGGHPAAC